MCSLRRGGECVLLGEAENVFSSSKEKRTQERMRDWLVVSNDDWFALESESESCLVS